MYTILDTKQVTELSTLRHGWFSPHYELTDGTYSYGELSYDWLSRRWATATTATGSWLFKRDGIFSRTILIVDQNGVYVGKTTRDWFSRKRSLTLQTGFKAEFYRSSLLYPEFVWESSGYGTIMRIKSFPFNLNDTIYIDPSMTPASVMPLLIFLGMHLTILRRRRRAAHY